MAAAKLGRQSSLRAHNFDPFLMSTELQWNAWLDLGIKPTKEGAGGEALGLFWIPSAMNPKSETRSYSKTGHFDPSSLRKNYHLLTGHKTKDIVISNSRAVGITIEARNIDSTVTTITATKEVVLAAGAFGSPMLLQRSGVGPRALLESAGIEVQVDLPGVGQNFQDHAATLLLYSCRTLPKFRDYV